MQHRFGQASTTDDVLEGVDLSGKRVFITGVSAGLGAETARALVSKGASVWGTARDLSKAAEVAARINVAGRHGGRLEVVSLDLADLDSVRRTADTLLAAGQPFDVFIANAGVMATPYANTVDGIERQFATNHLGHFLLVNRLLPLLAAGGRVVNLTSGAHRLADVDLDDPNFERVPYHAWTAYGRSKTANVLFTVALDARLKARRARAVAVHPGIIQTELSRDILPDDLAWFDQNVTQRFEAAGRPLVYKSVAQGAATTVWTAFVGEADAVGGRYCENCHVSPVLADASVTNEEGEGVLAYAVDPVAAERLWNLSEALVGERF